jgi:hypothetical protein
MLQEYNPKTDVSLREFEVLMTTEARKARGPGAGPFRFVLSEVAGNADTNDGVVGDKKTGAERHAMLYDASRVELIGEPHTLVFDGLAQRLAVSYAPLAARLRLCGSVPREFIVVSVHAAHDGKKAVRDKDWANLHELLGAPDNVLTQARDRVPPLWGAAAGGGGGPTRRDLSTRPLIIMCGDFNGPADELREAFSGGSGGGGATAGARRLHLHPFKPLLDYRTNAADTKSYDNILIESGHEVAFMTRMQGECGPNSDLSDHQIVWALFQAVAA